MFPCGTENNFSDFERDSIDPKNYSNNITSMFERSFSNKNLTHETGAIDDMDFIILTKQLHRNDDCSVI